MTQLLNLVVSIYSKFEGFDKIKQKYYDYLQAEGANLIKNSVVVKDEALIIKDIALFLEKHLRVLTQGFHKHQELYVTQTNAMEAVLQKWDKINSILLSFSKK